MPGIKLHASGVDILSEAAASGTAASKFSSSIWKVKPEPAVEYGLQLLLGEGDMREELTVRNTALCMARGMIQHHIIKAIKDVNEPCLAELSRFVIASQLHSLAGIIPCAVIYPSLNSTYSSHLSANIPSILRKDCTSLVVELTPAQCADVRSAFKNLCKALLDSDIEHRVTLFKRSLRGEAEEGAMNALLQALRTELHEQNKRIIHDGMSIGEFLSEWWPARLDALRHVGQTIDAYNQSVSLLMNGIETIAPDVLETIMLQLSEVTIPMDDKPSPQFIVVACSGTSREMFHRLITRKTCSVLSIREIYFMKAVDVTLAAQTALFANGDLPFTVAADTFRSINQKLQLNNYDIATLSDMLNRLRTCVYTLESEVLHVRYIALPLVWITTEWLAHHPSEFKRSCRAVDYAQTPLWHTCSRLAGWLVDEDVDRLYNLPSMKQWCGKCEPRSRDALRRHVQHEHEHFERVAAFIAARTGQSVIGQVATSPAAPSAAALSSDGGGDSVAVNTPSISAQTTTQSTSTKSRPHSEVMKLFDHLSAGSASLPRSVRNAVDGTECLGVPLHALPFLATNGTQKRGKGSNPAGLLSFELCSPVPAITNGLIAARKVIPPSVLRDDSAACIAHCLFWFHVHRIRWRFAARVVLRFHFGAEFELAGSTTQGRHEMLQLYEESLSFGEGVSSHIVRNSRTNITKMDTPQLQAVMNDVINYLIGDFDTLYAGVPLCTMFYKALLEASEICQPGRKTQGKDVLQWFDSFLSSYVLAPRQPLHEVFALAECKVVEDVCVGAKPCTHFYDSMSERAKETLSCRCCKADNTAITHTLEDLTIGYRSLVADGALAVGKIIRLDEWFGTFRMAYAGALAQSVSDPEQHVIELFQSVVRQFEYLGIVSRIRGKDDQVELTSMDPRHFWV